MALGLAIGGLSGGWGATPIKAADKVEFSKDGKSVYLNGLSVVLEGTATATAVYADSDKNGVKDSDTPLLAASDLSGVTVIGVYDNLDVTPTITVNSGTIGELQGAYDTVGFSPITINVKGGDVKVLKPAAGSSSRDVDYENIEKPEKFENTKTYAVNVNITGGSVGKVRIDEANVSRVMIKNDLASDIDVSNSGLGSFCYISKTKAFVDGFFTPVGNMSLSVPLTVNVDSTLNIPTGTTFATTAAVTNSGKIMCEGSFTKNDDTTAIGTAYFGATPTLKAGVDKYVADTTNSIYFPVTISSKGAGTDVIMQYLSLVSGTYIDENFGRVGHQRDFVKAGAELKIIVSKDADKVKHFYYVKDSKSVELKKDGSNFKTTMPAHPVGLILSSEDKVDVKEDESTDTTETKTEEEKKEEKKDEKLEEQVKEAITDNGEYAADKEITAETVTIPATVTKGSKKVSVTSIKAGAFKNNKKLKKITIPASVKTIGNNAFYGCTNLKTVVFAKKSKLASIGKNAFYNCKALTSVKITSTKLTKIGKKAFTKAGSKKYKALTVKVPKSRLTKYKKLLKKAGLNKNVKVKK